MLSRGKEPDWTSHCGLLVEPWHLNRRLHQRRVMIKALLSLLSIHLTIHRAVVEVLRCLWKCQVLLTGSYGNDVNRWEGSRENWCTWEEEEVLHLRFDLAILKLMVTNFLAEKLASAYLRNVYRLSINLLINLLQKTTNRNAFWVFFLHRCLTITYCVAKRSVWILLSLSEGKVGMMCRSSAKALFNDCVLWRSRTFARNRWVIVSSWFALTLGGLDCG